MIGISVDMTRGTQTQVLKGIDTFDSYRNSHSSRVDDDTKADTHTNNTHAPAQVNKGKA